MDEPDYSLPVSYRLPREGVLVQVWFAGEYNRWAYAVRRGNVWLVDSLDLPSEVPISWLIITHWREAPPAPGTVNTDCLLENAADVILDALPVSPRTIEAPRKQLPR